MDILKSWAATLCTAVVFISIANVIVPNNVMKKHVKFALSLILLAVMVLPITRFLSLGKDFESFNYDISYKLEIESIDENVQDIYSSEFLKVNLEQSLTDKLKEEFVGTNFEVSIDGELSINDGIDISRVNIIITDEKKIKKIEKVEIGEKSNVDVENTEDDKFIKQVKEYVAKELQLSSDKIKARYL